MAPIRETYYWVTRTPLFQDEALSSWLIRVALGCGCDPLSLTGIIWPKWRVWTIDIEKGLNQEYLEILARKTAVSQDQLNNATFKELFVQNNELNPHQWILALGTRNRKHIGGWQYCPKCLEEDPVAYYRLNWRYVLHVGCTKHQLRLLDQCPHCHKAIQPRLLEAPDRTLSCCAICKKNLSDVKVDTIDGNALKLQKDFDLFLRQGYAIYANTLITMSEWLNIIQLFNQFIRKVLRSSSNSKGWAFLNVLGIKVPHTQLLSTGLVLSQLSVLERERIFSCIYQLLNISQIKFIETARALRMNRSTFWDKRYEIPDILQPIGKHLDKVCRDYPLIKASSNMLKPSSKEAVQRRALKLKRKIS
ncbi:TniQ family protein [Acinetobacter baumannii]|nr:TniQ family protein [Acinetobacter baumannii]MDC5008800.1 TniQ family protein [Acinetobacter baumannii]